MNLLIIVFVERDYRSCSQPIYNPTMVQKAQLFIGCHKKSDTPAGIYIFHDHIVSISGTLIEHLIFNRPPDA